MSDDQAAVAAADKVWDEDGGARGVLAACRAYHRAMIAATPGLCVHEPDGTVRAITGLFASLSAEQQQAVLNYRGEENHGDPAFQLKRTDGAS